MSSVATARRLRLATGHLGLGMLNEASDELEAIEGEDRLSAEVMDVRCDLYLNNHNAPLHETADASDGRSPGFVWPAIIGGQNAAYN